MYNEVRLAPLFREAPRDRFKSNIRLMFFDLQERWSGIPFERINDGVVSVTQAREILRAKFPRLAKRIRLTLLDENDQSPPPACRTYCHTAYSRLASCQKIPAHSSQLPAP